MKELVEVRHDELDTSLELFMLTYMDLNHVAAIHRGLNSWVNTRDAIFSFADGVSTQIAPFNNDAPKQGLYKGYFEKWMEYHNKPPEVGAIWGALYPYKMYETYPGLDVESTIKLRNGLCVNTLKFYATTPHINLTMAAIAAYMETADEDKAVVENLDFDRRHHKSVKGTFHPILESGVPHWRKWMEANRGR